MKKIIIIFLFGIISIHSCGQKKDTLTHNFQKMKKNLQKFDSEPIYSMEIRSNYGYEILVNGFPIARNSHVTGLYSVPLNYYLYWSGIQNIEIKIYPKIYGDSSTEEDLKDGYFTLEIDKRYWTKDNILSEPQIIYSYEVPVKDYSDKKMFTHQATFNADIPYQLTDWRKGKTFKEEDSIAIKNKVLKFYQDLKYAFEHKEGEKYMQSVELLFCLIVGLKSIKKDQFN